MLHLISSFIQFLYRCYLPGQKIRSHMKGENRLERGSNNINANDFSRKRLCFKLLDDNLSAKSIDGLVDQLY